MANIYNTAEEAIGMSVVNKSPSWLDANYNTTNLNYQQHSLPIVPYTTQQSQYSYYYQQYLNQFLPYYYGLLNPTPINYNLSYSQPSLTAPEMDIENYINFELTKQQSLLRRQPVQPRPLGQLQLPRMTATAARQLPRMTTTTTTTSQQLPRVEAMTTRQLPRLEQLPQKEQMTMRQLPKKEPMPMTHLLRVEQLTTRQLPQNEQTTIRQLPLKEPMTMRLLPLKKQLMPRQLPLQEQTTPRQLPLKDQMTPRQLPHKEEQLSPQKLPGQQQQETRIINVQLIAMGPSKTGEKQKQQADVDPLPPVEESFKQSVAKIDKSQRHYEQLFGRLTSMLQTLNRRYDGHEMDPEEEQEQEEQSQDSQPEAAAAAPPSKRVRHDMSSSSSESQPEVEQHTAHAQYPQRIQLKDGNAGYVLGPHGTQINAKEYGQVFWTSAPVATRCLLAAVFSSDELATHTLTGKPSPAFYGRERPAKKMLDQHRVDDIVCSVRNRTGGKERHIRATITTKCADTAKKYKRRAKKALKDNVIIIDDE